MKNVTEQKKFTKKVCVFDKKHGYNNVINYELYLRDYTDYSFTYNKNEKQNMINDGKTSIIDIVKELNQIRVFTDNTIELKDIEKVINNLCRENTVFISKVEQKRQQLENDRKTIENYFDDKFGEGLCLELPKNIIHYNGNKLTNDMIQSIIMTAKTNNTVSLKDKDIKTILINMAAKRPYERQLTVNDDDDEQLNIDSQNYVEYYDTDGDGNPKNTIKNYSLYLEYSKQYKGKLALNELDKNPYVWDGTDWVYRDPDNVDSKIYYDLEKAFPNTSINRKNADDAMNIVQSKNSFHPIKDRLDRLRGTWDGIERLDSFFINFFDADDTRLNRNMTRKWFVAAMKRILEEGKSADKCVNFDGMLILVGGQGSGKTVIWKRLFGDSYVNNKVNIDPNKKGDMVDALNKAWCVVFDELASFKKQDMDAIKDFISTNSYTARLSYGHRAKFYPVHCVYCGSTNDYNFLRDNSDEIERRMWVMDVHSKGHPEQWWKDNLPDSIIDQVMAEALTVYESDPDMSLMLDDEDKQDLIQVQNEHKTWQLNTVNNETVEEVINSEFSKEIFKNYDDFNNSIFDGEGKGYKINIIRGSFLVQYLKSKGMTVPCATSLKPIMNQMGWSYKKYMSNQIPEYQGKWVYVKKEYENIDIPMLKDTENQMGLPF